MKKAKEAAEEKKKKAGESLTKEKDEKQEKEQYQRGVEMLDAAIALEEFVQGPDMSEHFRALRTEGCAAFWLAELSCLEKDALSQCNASVLSEQEGQLHVP